LVKGLDGEVLQLKSDIFKICWFMRGGITADEAFALSYDDRMVIADIVKENLETTKKTGMAFF
jgi:hypothetical protein